MSNLGIEFNANSLALIQTYGLSFVRCVTFVFCVPPFLGRPIPIRVRFAFAGLLGVFASNVGRLETDAVTDLPLLVLQEFIVGFAIGFATSSVLTAFQMAGSLIGRLAGGSLVMSTNSEKDAPVTAFYYGTATTLLFATGGHRTVVEALLMSFQSFPAGVEWNIPNSLDLLCDIIGTSFEFALRIAMPVGLALILATVVTAVISRFVRTFSFFGIGMSVNASLLVTALLFACVLLPVMFEIHFEAALELATQFLKSIHV